MRNKMHLKLLAVTCPFASASLSRSSTGKPNKSDGFRFSTKWVAKKLRGDVNSSDFARQFYFNETAGHYNENHKLPGGYDQIPNITEEKQCPSAEMKTNSPNKISHLNVKPIQISRPSRSMRSDGETKTNENAARIPLKYEVRKRIDLGRITCDFGTKQQQLSPDFQSIRSARITPSISSGVDKRITDNKTQQSAKEQGKIRMTMDPSAFARLIPIIYFASASFVSAMLGTLRLIGPLVMSKRLLVSIGNLISDWYTGRYFRTTYTRLEKLYIHYYETPATFRALSRILSQWFVYHILGRVMGWMVGISHPPCRSEGRGLAFFCALLWAGSVVGLGHAFAEGVALWGGPLRLQAVPHSQNSQKITRLWNVFIRPWGILQWMQNPEEWVQMFAEPHVKPFDPNPLLFPITWVPLRLLQLISLALVSSTEPEDYMWCSSEINQIPPLMSKYLLQLAVADEWVRVFLRERRVGLGIVVGVVYYFSMLSLLVAAAMINGKATLLMVPSMFASLISTWMNIVIFIERYEKRQKERKTKNVETKTRHFESKNENFLWG